MRVAIIAVFTDSHRRGRHHRNMLQPQIGPLIAALLPDEAEVEIINDTWTDPDWGKTYDLVFLSCMHSDFDRARQLGHYFRARGAKTILGGSMASAYPQRCAPYFDAVAIGDPEGIVDQIYRDAALGRLQPVYRSDGYQADLVPTPRCDLTIAQQVMPLALEATRGCPYSCDFCMLTGAGSRFAMRPVEKVVRDIRLIGQSLTGKVPGWQRKIVMFFDNNLAGNLGYFSQLCDALAPLGIYWGTCLTFNVLTRPDLLKQMYDSGCRAVFVGLESFNSASITGFNKNQVRLSQVRKAFDDARAEGIIVTSGLMLSPQHDDVAYIRSLPRLLKDSGLHVPVYVCIETPIPGTPLFRRLTKATEPAFMPNACLHDFNAYSLVIKPLQASVPEFIGAYCDVLSEIFSMQNKLAKLADDLPRLLRRGSWLGAAVNVLTTLGAKTSIAQGRTYVPETDILPPERVPLSSSDFSSERHFHDLMQPTRVTDAQGRVLPEWLSDK